MAVIFKSQSAKVVQIFKFGSKTDGNASMKNQLGGKGANLAEMASIGIPVPSGFTFPCEVSVKYKDLKGKVAAMSAFLSALWEQTNRGIEYLEQEFGYMPLVSVRSGARTSMPGMMDTILNVGLCSTTIEDWKKRIGEKPALDSYRRLIQMYSSVAMDIPMERFDAELDRTKEEAGVTLDSELSASDLDRLISRYFKVIADNGQSFPDSLLDQLKGAITAVFRSWDNARAIEYRKIHGIPDDWGTAVNVQAMVFGNMNDKSATGVLFTRDPAKGLNDIVGEFLVNAQGEDVVAGIRTPQPLSEMAKWDEKVLDRLLGLASKLEAHYKDMQDIEFTVQDGKLYILQTRSGKRTAKAAFKIAYDMVIDGLVTKEEAVGRVTQKQLFAVMQDSIDPAFKTKPTFMGIPAGGSIVSGVAVFSAEDAVNCKQPCILIRKETDPDDIAGMNAAIGILTSTGGMTSHAAVVARGMNKSCIVGATSMVVSKNMAKVGGLTIKPGSTVSMDGSTGAVWAGLTVPVIPGGGSKEVSEVLSWASGGSVSERLDISGAMSVKTLIQAVQASTSKSVYIDTAMFESQDANGQVLKDNLAKLKAALETSQADEIILDMATASSHLPPVDQMFNMMFALHPSFDDAIVAMKHMYIGDWPTALKDKIVVKTANSSPAMNKGLVQEGWKIMGQAYTFADLMNASGPVQVPDDIIQKVFGSMEAFEFAKKLIEEKTGKSLTGQVSVPRYWYEILSGKAA